MPVESIEMLDDSDVISLDDFEARSGPTSTDDPRGRSRLETVESPQDRQPRGTDASLFAPQYTPTDVGRGSARTVAPYGWFLASMVVMAAAIVMLLRGAASDDPEALALASASVDSTPPEPPEEPALDDGLRALALVNVRDPAQAQPFEQRHALLEQLGRGRDAKRVDWRLNRALDLLQAGDSPTPCQTFERALDQMGAEPDPSYRETLELARAPELSCAALERRREALLEQLRPAGEALRNRSSGRRRSARKGRTRARRASSAPTEPSPRTPDSDPGIGAGIGEKLDDGLRPFGKSPRSVGGQ